MAALRFPGTEEEWGKEEICRKGSGGREGGREEERDGGKHEGCKEG